MGLDQRVLFRRATSRRLERGVKRVPGGELASWRAASRYVAGRSCSESLAAAEMLLEAEIAQLVAQIAPQLLSQPGFGPLTAAKLVGEIAGAGRFATDAKLARAAGLAPIPVSSGKTNRHRLDRGGNRQIKATR